MQPDPYSQPDPYNQPEVVMVDPMTGMPSNVVIIPQESAAPKVVGILTIIYAAGMFLFSVIGLLGMSMLTNPDSEFYIPEYGENAGALYGFTIASTVLLIATLVGGIFMVQSKRIGVEITMASIVFGFILNLIGELTLTDVIAADPNSLGTGINIALQAVCALVCGMIVLIPMMVAGSQLKGPGLFGGGQQY